MVRVIKYGIPGQMKYGHEYSCAHFHMYKRTRLRICLSVLASVFELVREVQMSCSSRHEA